MIQQHPLNVIDEDGIIVGECYSDHWLEDTLNVELKAGKNIDENHQAQELSCLKPSNVRHGLLINFDSPKFQVRRFIL